MAPFSLEPVLTQESLKRELLRPVTNVVQNALAQGLQVLNNVLVGENSRNEEFEQVN